MNMLSLFAGIGGLDIAAHMVGIKTVAFCEIELYAQQVLRKRFPGIPIFDDVRKLTADSLREVMPDEPDARIDIICGGFP